MGTLLIFNKWIPVKLWPDVQYFYLSIGSFYPPFQNINSRKTGIFLFLFCSLLYLKYPADSKYSRRVFWMREILPLTPWSSKRVKATSRSSNLSSLSSLKIGHRFYSRGQAGTQRRGGQDYREKRSQIDEWLAHHLESNLLFESWF